MSDELAQREMTLDEWMDRLPRHHGAHLEFDALRARLATVEAQLAEVHGDLCENGHAAHEDCTSECACVGQGKSRMELLEAELAVARAEIAAMAKGTSHDCDIIADGADTEERLMQERDAARREVERQGAILRQLVDEGRLWVDMEDLQNHRVRVVYEAAHKSEVDAARAESARLREALDRVAYCPSVLVSGLRAIALAALEGKTERTTP